MNPPPPNRKMALTRWLIWLVFVTLWTVALLIPAPEPEALEGEVFFFTRRALVAKSLHVLANTVMTILSAWLFVPTRYRWLLIFFLMVHAGVTEQLQIMVAYRSGLLMDVLFDHLGVALGVALSWQWWTRPDKGR
jgi:VanZ family protein